MLYLASRSPRRRQILAQFGIEFKILATAVPENRDGTETAIEHVRRLALAKARAGKITAGAAQHVLAADTEVLLDDEILGKPADTPGAVAMLQKLSGRVHTVLTAVALVDDGGETIVLNTSRVSFKKLSRAECEAYCATGEPYDKAGGYAIQGRAAAFVTRLEGSYSGVMGLPVKETYQLLLSNKLLRSPLPTPHASLFTPHRLG
jgi:septum formation protein